MEIDTDFVPQGTKDVQQVQDVGPAFAPFDKPKSADVILRSSVPLDFRARKAILAEASAVFDNMFNLPQPPASASTSVPSTTRVQIDSSEYKDGLPVITLQEDSATLDALLRFCYPIPKKRIHDIDTLSRILTASMKYAMDGVTAMLREDLRRLASDFPLRTFCLAAQHGFVDEAKHAAKACLNVRRRTLCSSFALVPELKHVDGKTAFLLLDYHERCSDAVAHLRSHMPFLSADRVWFTCDDPNCPANGKRKYKLSGETRVVPMLWWAEYMEAIVETLKANPCSDAIRRQVRPLDTALKEALSCEYCRTDAQVQMHRFVDDLCKHVDLAVNRVQLNLNQ